MTARRALQLAWAVVRFGLPPLLGWVVRLGRGRREPQLGVQLRMAFEHLGLTYVKLGQYLAMRFDILPPEVCRELGKLFDDVGPMPLERAYALIEEELGAPVDELFAEFDPEPLAAASVAQVHEARTRDGERVAVKVQRPGIERVFRADIGIMRRFTLLADALHLLGRLSATEMLDQFARWTLRETDFVQEGETAERVTRNAEPFEVEPGVRWDLTTSRVLTLGFIEGVTLAHLVRIIEEGGKELLAELHPQYDVELILHRLTFSSLSQIFRAGLFHGDPHPGNVIILDDNRVAFVDFGIFGDLTPYDREILGEQIEQLAVGNIDASLRSYTRQLTITEESDARGYREEARAVLQEWYDTSLRDDTPLASRHLGKYIGRMIDISRRYRLLYDMDFLLYWRAMNALDSTALRMSPEFDLMGEVRQFFEQTRPNVAQRFADVVLDTRRLTDAAARGRADHEVLAGEQGAARRRRNAEARGVAAAAAAAALLVVSGAGGAGWLGGAALVAGLVAGATAVLGLVPR
jgi:ubiquinone biosynthesis protein